MSILIQNVRLLNARFDWQQSDLLIDGGLIAAIADAGRLMPEDADETWAATGKTLLPGLIEQHVHGAMGADVTDATPEAFAVISRFLASQGVTAFLATSMALDPASLQRVFSFSQSLPGSRMLGFHMEGPFLNARNKGAQNDQHIRLPDLAEFRRYPNIRLLTIAPDIEGAMPFIEAVAGEVVVSLGHTSADYDTGRIAFSKGARSLTHLFNAMPPMLHRAPGIIGAALAAGAYAELISDGIHVHPAVVLAAWRMFGSERLILVSDSMRATGLSDGLYDLGGQPVEVSQGVARTMDGSIAGSTSSVWQCIGQAVRFGIPLADAVRMASLTPATLLGEADRRGSIAVGKIADLVLLDQSGRIEQTIIDGAPYESQVTNR